MWNSFCLTLITPSNTLHSKIHIIWCNKMSNWHNMDCWQKCFIKQCLIQHSEDRALWYILSLGFADCLLAGSGQNGVPSWYRQQSAKHVWHIPIAVYTVLDCWWRTENLSETCRVLLQKYIWESSASRWFYYKKNKYCLLFCPQQFVQWWLQC